MKNNTLKKLQKWFQEQFAGLVSAYQEGKLNDEDLEHYLAVVPNSFAVLEEYKASKDRQKHIEEYKKIVNNNVPLASELKEQALNTLKLLNEELEMTERDQALEPTKALAKHNKLRRLERKIEEAKLTITILDDLAQQLETPKRPVGRPRKQKNTPKETV